MPDVVIEGGAKGADECAGLWASLMQPMVTLLIYAVDHDIDGPWPSAGPRRNARMLREGKPDRGLAFGPLWTHRAGGSPLTSWKRTGTGDMAQRMLRAGLPVRWVASPEAAAVDLTEMPDPPHV